MTISIIDVYCTWIFFSFSREMKRSIPNKRLNQKRQQSVVHLEASIRLCVCSAVGSLAAVGSILVSSVLQSTSQFTADVVYIIAYNIFDISMVLCGIFWIELKTNLRRFEEVLEDEKIEVVLQETPLHNGEDSATQSMAGSKTRFLSFASSSSSKDEKKTPLISLNL
jgi:hypothetical protein